MYLNSRPLIPGSSAGVGASVGCLECRCSVPMGYVCSTEAGWWWWYVPVHLSSPHSFIFAGSKFFFPSKMRWKLQTSYICSVVWKFCKGLGTDVKPGTNLCLQWKEVILMHVEDLFPLGVCTLPFSLQLGMESCLTRWKCLVTSCWILMI